MLNKTLGVQIETCQVYILSTLTEDVARGVSAWCAYHTVSTIVRISKKVNPALMIAIYSATVHLYNKVSRCSVHNLLHLPKWSRLGCGATTTLQVRQLEVLRERKARRFVVLDVGQSY